MSKPVVAIVGRPNVGKSTLFNVLAGEMISIVKDTPGVTRDRIYADVTWLDKEFTMIDTGGIEPESKDIILSQMREQAQIAIDTADVIIFITDVRQGLVDADSKVADMLRRSGKPVVLAVNKVDNFDKFMPDVYEFYNLGIGDPVPVSAASRLGIGDMLDAVIAHFPEHEAEEKEDERPRVAIVGKPNVGKSSIINKLTGKQRVIVSDVAGTTRDAIDTNVKYNGKDYVFIDTAGLRRKSKIKEELERYSIIRTVTAVERADVVLVVIDATEGVTEQDAKIAGIAHERGKGIIIVVNKWDAIEKNDKTMREYENNVRRVLSFMPYAEIMYVSAETGQRLNKLYDMIDMVIENQTLRVATGVLNEIMTEAVAMQQPPSDKGKRLKLYYITQVAVKPPSFVIFVNNKELMHFSYTRYLENKIREAFGFRGTALKFFIRERLICVLVGYVFGLIQTGYLYGKKNGVDLRKKGSGNAGTTNALRTMGWKAGGVTLLGDCFKCVAAVVVVHMIYGKTHTDMMPLLSMYAGMGVVLGHNYPFYLKFKGGKGIAATAGLIISTTNIWIVLICLAAFIAIVATTRYVSLGSMTVVTIYLISVIVYGQHGGFHVENVAYLHEMYGIATFLMILAFWRHRANIKRLLSGTENKISVGGKDKK